MNRRAFMAALIAAPTVATSAAQPIRDGYKARITDLQSGREWHFLLWGTPKECKAVVAMYKAEFVGESPVRVRYTKVKHLLVADPAMEVVNKCVSKELYDRL